MPNWSDDEGYHHPVCKKCGESFNCACPDPLDIHICDNCIALFKLR